MSYLQNDQIRFGVNLAAGGAVTFLSKGPAGPNMINSYDWGRQVQMSFYSGPVPFQPPGSVLAPQWRELGWNPIQSGDHFHHGSRIVEHRNSGKSIYVKCVPMIWPLDRVPAECTFEATYSLAGKTVEAHCRMNNARRDKTQYSGRHQELPAVYANGPWYKLVSYTGDNPFTGDALTTLVDRNDGRGWPWLSFLATEHWAALVNKDDQGVGIFQREAVLSKGGFAGGPKGTGGPTDFPTGYIAPLEQEILDYNIAYEYDYVLIAGSLQEIRAYAVAHASAIPRPKWTFHADRQHWCYANTTDAGWPITGELKVNLNTTPSLMLSPTTFWKAGAAGTLVLEAAFDAPIKQIGVIVEPLARLDATAKLVQPKLLGPANYDVQGDGIYREYRLPLGKIAGYSGAMQRLQIVLPAGNGVVRLKSVQLGR